MYQWPVLASRKALMDKRGMPNESALLCVSLAQPEIPSPSPHVFFPSVVLCLIKALLLRLTEAVSQCSRPLVRSPHCSCARLSNTVHPAPNPQSNHCSSWLHPLNSAISLKCTRYSGQLVLFTYSWTRKQQPLLPGPGLL